MKKTISIPSFFILLQEVFCWKVIVLCFQIFPGLVWAHHLEQTEEFSDGFFQQETLTGNWNGFRTRLQKQGWVPELNYSGGIFYNPLGAIENRVDYAGFLEIDLHADLESIMGWPHARALVDLIHLHGTDPSANLFTTQTVSNLEASDQFKVFLAWIEQFGWDGKLSLKAGIYSLDTEFDFKKSANLFINGVFGTGIDLSETGINGPAIFPNSGLGARLYLEPFDRWYLQVAVIDGIPGDPEDPTGTNIQLSSNDGLQIASETGYRFLQKGNREAKVALGSLMFTTNIPDLTEVNENGTPVPRSNTFGIYGFFDWPVTFERMDPYQGANVFLRFGAADSNVARFDFTLTGGIVYTGLFPGRPQDILGLGFSGAWNSDKFQKSQPLELQGQEWAFEISHQISISPGFEIQPNIQYFINPGSRADIADAFYLGGTFNLAF